MELFISTYMLRQLLFLCAASSPESSVCYVQMKHRWYFSLLCWVGLPYYRSISSQQSLPIQVIKQQSACLRERWSRKIESRKDVSGGWKRGKADKKEEQMNQCLTVTVCRGRRQIGQNKQRKRREKDWSQRNRVIIKEIQRRKKKEHELRPSNK